MLVEIMSTYYRLKKWKDDPTQTKHQIGVMSRWIEGGEGTNVPLSEGEVDRMKDFLRRVNPTAITNSFLRSLINSDGSAVGDMTNLKEGCPLGQRRACAGACFPRFVSRTAAS